MFAGGPCCGPTAGRVTKVVGAASTRQAGFLSLSAYAAKRDEYTMWMITGGTSEVAIGKASDGAAIPQ